jgi:hypothetical protein
MNVPKKEVGKPILPIVRYFEIVRAYAPLCRQAEADGRTDGDGRADGRTDGRTDRQTDRQIDR